MSNWSIKLKNNTENISTYFLNSSLRFKRGYKNSEIGILKNLNAIFEEQALIWFQVNRNNRQNFWSVHY